MFVTEFHVITKYVKFYYETEIENIIAFNLNRETQIF